MIIISIFGGLGNQMFQYALGKIISVRNNTCLFVDSQFLNPKFQKSRDATIRSYELSAFNIEIKEASLLQKNTFVPFISLKNRKIIGLNIKFNPCFVFENKPFIFQNIPGRKYLYLYGYWQSWKYFSGYEDLILKEFQFKKPLSGKNLTLIEKINKSNSCSIHMRFGDYSVENVLPKDYFIKAIDQIKLRNPDVTFFVFSDDPVKARNYLKEFNYESVNENCGQNSYIDMQLMCNCKHNIIANSSFSWWSAWLNRNPDKIVIAPGTWYKNNKTLTDLLPPKWELIKI